MRTKILSSVFHLGRRAGAWLVPAILVLFLLPAGEALAACGDPGASPCSCGWGGLGRCCDYDYLVLLGECSDSSGFPTFCGGTNERACRITEHTRACKSGRVNVSGTCRRIDGDGYPTICGGVDESPCTLDIQIALGITSCKPGLAEIPFPGGTCKRLDSDGFPTFCGGEGERPCNLNEHIPSCKSGLAEVPFPGGDCTRIDSDGFPHICGGAGERACNLNEHIPSCKVGLIEFDGKCDSVDGDGYPTLCGDVGEPACTVDIQLILGITSCKPSTTPGVQVAEIPFGFGTCIELDGDGFPPHCGGEGERPCTLLEHVPSCKKGLEEDFLQGTCRDTFPAACGRNGQRPCLINENLLPCKLGYSVRDFDFGECGENPESWPASEVARGGPRSVFIIHGRGGDLADFADRDASGINKLAHQLKFEVPNVRDVYGVDWNAKPGNGARKLTVRELYLDKSGSCSAIDPNGDAICAGGTLAGQSCGGDADCQGPETIDHAYGAVSFDYDDFRVYEVTRALAEAIMDLPTEENITIITTSYGGVIGRHLVYRHYDEMRHAGKRIAEMVNVAAPHLGGGMATPEVPLGQSSQNTLACAADLLNLDRTEWHNVCELGRWHDFRKRREDGILGPPFGSIHIDNRDYPQIRWINVAQNGYRLTVLDDLAAKIDPGSYGPIQQEVDDFLWLLSQIDNYDSDGTILTSSEWGIEADECYPFTRAEGPQGLPIEVAPVIRDNGGQPVLSAQCHHPAARVDGRYMEQEELRLEHVFDDADIREFITAALSVAGDRDGDGVITPADETVLAQAGADRTIECTGPLTDVTLDATPSSDPAGGGLTYTWSGAFGSASGAITTIPFPIGSDMIHLTVEDALGRTDGAELLVEVVDSTPPVLIGGDDVTLEATSMDGAPFVLAPDSASDLCGEVSVTVSPQLAVYPLGKTVVTLTATDGSGNAASVSRIVEVVDTTPPQIFPPAGLTREAIDVLTPVDIGLASAADLFLVDVSNDAPDDGYPMDRTVVTWTARDSSGNEASAAQEITIVDTTPPEIVVPGALTAEATGLLSPVEIGTATATDIFAVSVASDAPDEGYPLGETLVTWTATDSHGNDSTGTQRVTVVDTTPPALTVPEDISVIATGPLTSIAVGTASATDLFGPVTTTNDGPAEGFPPGTTEVTWTATDANGNRTTQVQRVQATYSFGGIFPPLESGGIYKAARTLPVKFALSFAGGETVDSAVARIQVVPLGADSTPGEALDVESSGSADSGDGFRYEGGQYHFNLNTSGMPDGRYRILILLDDGTTHALDVILR